MSRYFEAPDAENEPTIWLSLRSKPQWPVAILRRCDLPESARPLWGRFVAAVVES